jgi:hypothetical protein
MTLAVLYIALGTRVNEFTELRWITIQSGHRHYPF